MDAYRTCNGPYDQGRKPCPTPDACRVVDEDEVSGGTVLWLLLLIAFVVAVLLIL